MGSTTPEFDWREHRAVKPLHVIIVGAGIGGLAAGIALHQTVHHVTILEKHSTLQQKGSGMVAPPNMTRILDRLGIIAEVMQQAEITTSSSPRRYANDEKLGDIMSGSAVGKYGWPVAYVSRADLSDVLFEVANSSGIDVILGKPVVDIDKNFKPRLTTADGEWFEDASIPTGGAAYFVTIPGEKMAQSERTSGLISQRVSMRWLGPGGHIMAHPLQGNTAYTMVMIHAAKANSKESWSAVHDKEEVMKTYKDWSATVRDLINFIPEDKVTELSLHVHAPLPSWFEGRVALLGDACHPMLPYVGQGGANAIEDAAVLAAALTKTSDIDLALRVYEKVREQRAEAIQRSATANQTSLHLPDGPEQQARDETMRMAAKGQGNNPDKYADSEWQDFMWETDVMKQTMEEWEEPVGRRYFG